MFNRVCNRFGNARRINVAMQQNAGVRLRRTLGSVCCNPNKIYVVTHVINGKMRNTLLSLEAATMVSDNAQIKFEDGVLRPNQTPATFGDDTLADYSVAEFLSCLCETLFSICANREDDRDELNSFESNVIRHPDNNIDFTLTFSEKDGDSVSQFRVYQATTVCGEVNAITIKREPGSDKLLVDFHLFSVRSGAMGEADLNVINCEVSGKHLQSLLA